MLRKDSFLFRHRKKIIIMILLVVVIVGGVSFYSFKNKSKFPVNAVNAFSRETAQVSKGNIKSSITGSGTIASSSTKKVASEVNADVLSVNVSVGDKVKKGDVLVELDKTDYQKNIRELNNKVSNLTETVNSYKEDIENLYVYAEKDGYVSNLTLEEGDSVSKNSTIMKITNDEYYYLTCKFNYNSNLNIKVGDKAKVMLVDTFKYLDAEVSYVSELKEISSTGLPIQSVEMKIKNPGYTLDGITVSVELYTGNLTILATEQVTITSDKSKAVKSKSSGTVKEIYIHNGDYIKAGSLVMILENDDLYDNLSDAKTNLSDAYEDLASEKENLDFYTITAPIDGIITDLNISEGDYVRSESTLLTLVNNDVIEFDIEVDELDINDIKVGQSVNVTIDAIDETAITPIIGFVTNISIEGNSMNSVTSYPVTVTLSGDDTIKMGMNCSAEIIIESKEDVLCVPVEAITTKKDKYYVTLKDESLKEVEIGMYDEDNIEIISGLEEGEEILLPVTVKATETENSNEKSQGGMNFGGGMPSGMNMQGGGMPGGNFGGGRPNM